MGALTDRFSSKRMVFIAVGLGLLGVVYLFMGPWQLTAFSAARREAILVPYLILEGLICPLLEPTFLPQMLETAERSSGANEHLTNFVTSLGQTSFNAGLVAGPLLGVPTIQRFGFRGAMVLWGGFFLAVTFWVATRLGLGRLCCGGGKRAAGGAASGQGSAKGYAPLAASDGE